MYLLQVGFGLVDYHLTYGAETVFLQELYDAASANYKNKKLLDKQKAQKLN